MFLTQSIRLPVCQRSGMTAETFSLLQNGSHTPYDIANSNYEVYAHI